MEEAIKILERAGQAKLEVTGVIKGGRHIPYEIYGTLLQDMDENPACICLIARDITEHKQA